MANTLNLSLTDEPRAFIDENCRDGTLYAAPSEFGRDLLRQRKRQAEVERARDAILEGDQNAIAGRTVPFNGNLRSLLRKRGDPQDETLPAAHAACSRRLGWSA